MFAPFARHFLVHSSWPATAPLAPHCESETYPFTVSAFLEPAELIVTMNSTSDRTIQISNNFFIANISSSFAAGAADSGRNQLALPLQAPCISPAPQRWSEHACGR